jgi:hypothetical protein
MPVKIVRFNLTHLWNGEYPLFVTQLVSIIDKHQPDSLQLTKTFARLTDLLPQLAKIKARELNNAKSEQLEHLDDDRDALIKGIWLQVKNYGAMRIALLAPHVEVMKRFLNIHGNDIADSNYNSETKRVRDLLADYDAKPDVKIASENLHLDLLFEELRSLNTQFADLFLLRNDEESTVETVNTRAIRSETDKRLIALFDGIEFCSKEYEDLDYQPLANEMNGLVNYYKAQLKARTTRRNKKKDSDSEDIVVEE